MPRTSPSRLSRSDLPTSPEVGRDPHDHQSFQKMVDLHELIDGHRAELTETGLGLYFRYAVVGA